MLNATIVQLSFGARMATPVTSPTGMLLAASSSRSSTASGLWSSRTDEKLMMTASSIGAIGEDGLS